MGRFEFAVGYLDCVDLVHQASLAEAAGDRVTAAELTEKALDRLRAGVASWARVARDPSDLGATATINEFAYRRLQSQLGKLQDVAV